MAFKGIAWTDETKSKSSDPARIAQIKREKEASREREAARVAAYERAKPSKGK